MTLQTTHQDKPNVEIIKTTYTCILRSRQAMPFVSSLDKIERIIKELRRYNFSAILNMSI